MAITDKKTGSVLLNAGINVSTPAEYIDDHSLRNSINYEINRDLIKKRSGTTELGDIVSFGILTLGANPSNTNTVTIGSKVYTFQTTLTNVDGNVLIGATDIESVENLTNAINLGSGAGTTYAAATTAHPSNVLAVESNSNVMKIEVPGSVIATTTTIGSSSWAAATTAYSSEPTIMAGREFISAGTKYNVRIGLDKIERYNTGTGTWVNITGTDLTGTLEDNHNTAVPLLNGNEVLCITNGVDAIKKWTGTGNVENLGGTPPVAKYIQEYKTYLVCANIAGGVDVSQRVQWCDTADPETWNSGNAGAVDLVEDGEEITGLNIFGDYLTVHKKSSIYVGALVSSSSIFQFARKSTGSGTVANNSIQNLPTGHQIFLADDGIRLFNGISSPLIESKINDEIRDELNSEYSYTAWSVIKKDKDEVWIGMPIGSQTQGETVYKYNYVTGILYKDERIGANAAWNASTAISQSWNDFTTSWDDDTTSWNERTLNTGSSLTNIGFSSGRVFYVDGGSSNDGALAINAYFITKDFQDSQQVISRWKGMELWAKGGSVNVEYSTDGGNTWREVSNSPVTLTAEFPDFDNPTMLFFDVVASKIRFKFINDKASESLTIKQFIIDYKPREYRK
jgi:hypothetical protein